MEVSSKAKHTIWVTWLLIVPFSIYLVYTYTTPKIAGYEIDIISFLLLTAIISVLPIVVNDTTILFTEGLSLVVFLFFGLFIEILLAQISMVVYYFFKARGGVKELYRLPLNSLLFLGISLGGGSIYFLLGGTTGQIDTSTPSFLIPVLGYLVGKFYFNYAILRLIRQTLQKRKEPFIGRDVLWEALTILIHFPVGLVLYMLYVETGLMALVYVGIPLIGVSIIIRLLHHSQLINYYLQKASEIGHELAGRLEVDEVLDLFIEKSCKMLPVDYAYILENVDGNKLKVIRFFSKNKGFEKNSIILSADEGIAGRVWSTRKALLFNTKKEILSISKGYLPDSVESALCVPVIRHEKVVSVIVLTSNRRRSFEKYQLTIVDLLASYLAVAVENARHHEETKNKSERCALTGLYNYYYFEQVLEKEFLLLEKDQIDSLSLILLDIDHFKSINDTYGHQSGNEILCELASRLEFLIGDVGTVARYGGEEFVLLLPNMDKHTTYQLAETIRQMIANRPFTIHDDLSTYRKSIQVRITASIGFATAPFDAESAMELVRHADRAMYTGAKQAGRNRVAEYVK